MSKKLTWEVDKTSLVLKVTDGAKETTWKLRKSMQQDQVARALNEMFNELTDNPLPTYAARESAWLDQTTTAVDADSEEASRAAQAARVAQLNVGAKWFEAEDDIYPFDSVQVPDYDTGEI